MINTVLDNLKKNNYDAHFVAKKEDVIPLVKELIPENSVISFGGSVTLNECGVLDYLRNGKYELLDRNKPGLAREEIEEIYRKAFFADFYLTGTNAITEGGQLYNVDGNGNRVAAMIFGPKNVIVVTGINKIVKDINEAELRIKNIAAPKNCDRLSMDTYCNKMGNCVKNECGFFGCDSDLRICCDYVVMGRQRKKDRIKVIIVGEELGY